MKKWGTGVVEYWSIGLICIACYNQSTLKGISTRNEFYLSHHSNIPLLHYSNTPAQYSLTLFTAEPMDCDPAHRTEFSKLQ